MTAFDRDNLQLIFSALVDWWLRKFSYSQSISKLGKGLVGALHDVFCLQRPVLYLAETPSAWCHTVTAYIPLVLGACCKPGSNVCSNFHAAHLVRAMHVYHMRLAAGSLPAGWCHA
jgi:hypothetical protein